MKNETLKEAETSIDSLPNGSSLPNDQHDAKPLSGLNRQLTEDDLKSAGVRKMLLGQMDDFDECKTKLQEMSDKFHERDKCAAILETKLMAYVGFDWLYSLLLTVGSILIGYYASRPSAGWILLLMGIVSILISVFLKYRNTHEN